MVANKHMDQTMQVPPNPIPPMATSRVPFWTVVITAVLLVIHFVYDFAAYTGTVPQKSVPLISITLFVVELILVIFLVVKKRYIAFLFLALIALNAYISLPLVKFAVTKTATEKALQGDTTATKNLSPTEGLKVLNQEAARINQLNTESGKLWNVPAPDFSTMNNQQFQTLMQKSLDIFEERKKLTDTFRADYEKYKQYIDVKEGETPGFDKMYAWSFVSPSGLACYDAQYSNETPIMKQALQTNYDNLTAQQKATWYDDVYYPGVREANKVCRGY